MATSDTVTGLAINTMYNVTVTAINTCCGAGNASEVRNVSTNSDPTTLPTSDPPTTTPGMLCTIGAL